MEPQKINPAGLALIRNFEGLKLRAYHDIKGVLTIGVGHTGPDVHDGLVISDAQAEDLLKKDLEKFESGVSHLVKVALTLNQFSSLVCLSFNIGLGNLASSTLLRLLNEGKPCADEFLKWDHSGGKEVPGLLRRREAERALFLTP